MHTYPVYAHVCRVSEYLYGKLFDIKSCRMNPTLAGSIPTPLHDHYERLCTIHQPRHGRVSMYLDLDLTCGVAVNKEEETLATRFYLLPVPKV